MPNTLARQLQNRLFTAGRFGAFFTVVRNTNRRQKQWQACRADKVAFTTGFYRRSEFRSQLEFMPCTDPMSEAEITEALSRWGVELLPIKNGNSQAYEALLAEAARQELPKNYREDLTKHDKAVLLSPGWTTSDFIWALRTSGTHIIALDNSESPKQAPGMVQSIGRFGDDEILFYRYSLGKLREITYDDALRIAREIRVAA